MMDVKEETETKLVLSCFLPDMEQGFPGNMTITVNYTLTDDDTLVLDFTGISDKNTVCNLTNHMYFNLDGHDQGNACDNSLQLNCSYMTPFDSAESIPNGTLRAVEGTPMDFLKLHPINDKINEDYDQLSYGAGYDHNYCIDNYDGSMQVAAIAKGNQTGICMEIATDCPGIQLYAGNFIG